MQAHIRNAVALASVGTYDFKGPAGEEYRFIDLYDEEQGAVVRLSIDKDCNPPADLSFGSKIDLWAEVVNNEKIVRGEDRDRSMKSLKLRVVSIENAKAAATPVPAPKAA